MVVPGDAKARRLADMTIPPQPEPLYELPPTHECETYDGVRVGLLVAGHELCIRFVIWTPRNLVVDFSVEQRMLHEGEWVAVARIDTKHRTVHRHQYSRADPQTDLYDRRVLAPIPAIGGYELVNDWYRKATQLLDTEWEENVRRWKG